MFYSGADGSIRVGGVKQARASNWSVQVSQSMLDTTTLEDNYQTVTPGLRTTQGSARIYYYADGATAPVTGDTEVGAIINRMIKTDNTTKSESMEFDLRMSYGTGYRRIRFTGYLTNVSMAMAVGEVFAADIQFQCDGPIDAQTY